MDEQNTPVATTPTAQPYAIPFAIIVAGLAIAGAIYFGDGKNETANAQANIAVSPVTSTDHILGNPKAKVIIVEYSDPECPWCKVFHTTMNRIMSEYGESGKVAWVYRHWVARPDHTRAPKEIEAAECANKINGNAKFWEYLNKMFEITAGNNQLDPAELPKIAKIVGLDMTAFNNCLNNGEMKTITESHLANGQKAGKGGTPYSIVLVNNKPVGAIEGAQKYEVVKAQIDALLK